MPKPRQPTCVLSIAGSDSSGGAGVAVDLRTFAAFGVHGLCAITAVTAQTQHRVRAIHPVPAAQLEQQLRTACDEFEIVAVKIGMLATAANVHTVAAVLAREHVRHVVLDPVLAASSGGALLSAQGLRCLREELLPRTTLLTPNLPEAQRLLGRKVSDPARAAQALRELGAAAVLLKGGHAAGRVVRDVLVDDEGVFEFRHPRQRFEARGTGCALSSAIACGLARGLALRAAISDAEAYVQSALANGIAIGKSRMRILSTPR